MNTYGRIPISFTHGKGVYLYDTEGNEYIDAISGIGVNALGHSHPAVSHAIKKQADLLIHTSNLYGIEKQQKLADSLCSLSGMDNVFFSNSGAEANEAAIKIARLYGHNKGIETPTIIVMNQSFHGRTLATLSATGNSKIQQGFQPLVEGFIHVPYSDLNAIKDLANSRNDIVAILAEPIQGEGGVNMPADNFITQLRQLCDDHQWLLMLDEVQTGNARTGKYFAYQHHNILPDIVTTAKGLGNGLPIGACLAHGEAAKTFNPGNHGSTYGGNPLVCSAAQAVIDTIEKDQLCENAHNIGAFMLEQFNSQLASLTAIKDIRGQGLMIGIELDQNKLNKPCSELVSRARERGLLINVTATSVIRLLPPLIINQEQAQAIVSTVVHIINDFVQTASAAKP